MISCRKNPNSKNRNSILNLKESNMKILVSSLSRNFGGVESLFLNIVNNIKQSDYQMDFVCTDQKAAREEDFEAAGARVIHIARPSKKIREYTTRFREVFNTGHYDIYHVNLTRYRFPLDVLIAKIAGKKVILHCHSTQIYSNNSRRTKVIREVQQFLFRPVMLGCSSLNIACSETAGEYLFGKAAYRVLYNGIDTSLFSFDQSARDSIRKKLGIENRIVIGHIGRFSPEKNHRFLLQLTEELIKTNSSYVLLCVGNGELFDRIKAYVENKGIQDHVILLGERKDIPELLSAMDIFAFPSLHEALPVTLIEAQANGLPCIISDCVTPEIDVLHLNRLSVSEGIEKWVESIRKTPLYRFDMNKHQKRLEEFDIHKMTCDLVEIYKGLL